MREVLAQCLRLSFHPRIIEVRVSRRICARVCVCVCVYSARVFSQRLATRESTAHTRRAKKCVCVYVCVDSARSTRRLLDAHAFRHISCVCSVDMKDGKSHSSAMGRIKCTYTISHNNLVLLVYFV